MGIYASRKNMFFLYSIENKPRAMPPLQIEEGQGEVSGVFYTLELLLHPTNQKPLERDLSAIKVILKRYNPVG